MKPIIIKSAILLTPCLFARCDREAKKIQDRPNILIVMGDDISYPHMGAYGTGWVKTPGFDRVASEGILFRNAYTPNAKSAPSRACFLTGLNSWQLEEAANHVPFFPLKYKSFMELLASNGYYTGHTAKGWAPGVALDSTGNPRQLTGKAYNAKRLAPPATGISDIDYSANFEEFLNSRNSNDPFCFWYGSLEPHRAYEYGSGAAKGGGKKEEINNVPAFWPDDGIVRNDMLDYAFEIEHFDNHLVKMLEILEKKGELENTIVIVTADNGMPFPRIKGQAYEYSNHMPLAIMWKKGIRNPGRKVYDFISFIDFAPTLIDIAAVNHEEAGMHRMEGKSFSDIFRSRKKGYIDRKRDHVLIGKERHDVGRPDDIGYPIRGIVKDGFLYIRNYKPERWPAGNPETGYLNTDGSPTKSLILALRREGISPEYWKKCFGKRDDDELFNIGSDPECLNNLSNDPGYSAIKRRLNDQLIDELISQEDPRIKGNGDVFDQYPYADSRTKDFYNRFKKGELHRKDAGWVDSTDFETTGF
ncbi:MAG TPA: sulfatase [Bacteroidales bacterium]|nr:sulfatase [Bacteroidales bacterium]